MMQNRVIPAKTTGIYRSLLEQSWARCFVDFGIPFVHEPQYYGNWLPDFFLPDCKALIEIKPTIEIADAEIPAVLSGMFQAYKAHHDIVVIVGEPYGDTISRIHKFADVTALDYSLSPALKKLMPDYDPEPTIDKFFDRQAELVRCLECRAYFFIGLNAWTCRHCGAYNGDQHFEGTKLFG